MSEQLLPCPFCGDSNTYFAHPHKNGSHQEDKRYWCVVCDTCEAESFGCYCTTQGDAAREWNTRDGVVGGSGTP